MLLEEHRLWTSQLEAVNKVLEEMILKVPHVEKLLAIKGVGSIIIAGFIAEVGDIRRFDSPKQIQKYAGLELVENSSGKHKGRTRISKRGRRKLRKILYQVMVPLLARNKEFRGIYDYYVTRVKNPLRYSGVRPHKEKINISKEIINKTRGAVAPCAARMNHTPLRGEQQATVL